MINTDTFIVRDDTHRPLYKFAIKIFFLSITVLLIVGLDQSQNWKYSHLLLSWTQYDITLFILLAALGSLLFSLIIILAQPAGKKIQLKIDSDGISLFGYKENNLINNFSRLDIKETEIIVCIPPDDLINCRARAHRSYVFCNTYLSLHIITKNNNNFRIRIPDQKIVAICRELGKIGLTPVRILHHLDHKNSSYIISKWPINDAGLDNLAKKVKKHKYTPFKIGVILTSLAIAAVVIIIAIKNT